MWQHHAEPSVHLRHRRAATVRVPRMLPKAYTVQQVAQSIAGYQGSKLQTTYPVILSAEAWWTKGSLTWNGRGSKLHYRGFVLNTNKCLLKKNYIKWGVPVGNSATLNERLTPLVTFVWNLFSGSFSAFKARDSNKKWSTESIAGPVKTIFRMILSFNFRTN